MRAPGDEYKKVQAAVAGDIALIVFGAGMVEHPALTACLGASLAITLYSLFALIASLTIGLCTL